MHPAPVAPYKPQNHVRIVTAAALFDGHDAAINIMRRIIQASGAEVIHLGHNRSVQEIVDCAIQEDAQAIAITSYQGGHNEFFKYMHDLLKERGAGHIKIFGGGGGVILPSEIEELQGYGITRIYSPDDGRAMGLQGMINDLLEKADFPTGKNLNGEAKHVKEKDALSLGRLISAAENFPEEYEKVKQLLVDSYQLSEQGQNNGQQNNLTTDNSQPATKKAPILGITGTGGAGKSSLVDELVRRFLLDFPDKTIAIISVDPSKRKTGGALLGDRIRMNAINNPRVYMRSLATRQSNLALSKYVQDAVDVVRAADFDLIILETSGIGQSDTEIIEHSDASLYVMTPEYGAATQLEKIDMLDFADVIALNKFDKRGAQDALRDVRKQYQRNHQLWDKPLDELPVYGTIASQFNDPGMNRLYRAVLATIEQKTGATFSSQLETSEAASEKVYIIPPHRTRYLSEITETIRQYDQWVDKQAETAQQLYGIQRSIEAVRSLGTGGAAANGAGGSSSHGPQPTELATGLEKAFEEIKLRLDGQNWRLLETWPQKVAAYKAPEFIFKVRDKEIRIKTHSETLSHLQVPKVATPRYEAWGDLLKWMLQENVPGEFPYTAGVFPFKREGEDPTRMFAGEGGPERTNRRFHYVSAGLPAKRLSTAFDSVTLYGEDPDLRPDIYGKIGNSGVSICCLDDAKKLYSGFNLADPVTSVSMTINGPAATLAACFMNAAIDQQCELYIKENGLEAEVDAKINQIYEALGQERPRYQGQLPEGNDGLGLMLLGVTGDQVLPAEVYEPIKARTLSQVRGTVQADILKEDQAQNTCIFSTEFSLRLMGDVQQYFITNKVRNFYSVSISGYHIAEAGANPITQLALTLSNGFTFVEYYVSRGMDVNDFAPNLSFFFSNGMDPEYSVMGRVARRIWAKAMKLKYSANSRSQMLKYHIQTSGRSLHAQEIDFNDIRTTLQALYAIYDNCNSLHTNAYDEAITTPTEESVRRAMAIQLIINRELGLAKNENPLQGSFIIEELTDLVEEAVMAEFDRITERGGVLGAMETMYQRGKIQEESLYYEMQKHTGELPIIGVNTFLSSKGSPTVQPAEVIRATEDEKQYQISMLQNLHVRNRDKAEDALKRLQQKAVQNENLFEELMETVKSCSLGQITNALFEVGGQYRRNM
ncbi:methylmalonyl-CoA mutase [Hymenobacter oligotrophus]|uniref:Fused isobutyryl-CoA mutase n=1 Tax=Hymenobacter oligotrophus TaxID=2319843 RepID=A0A3B7RA34_9BACT|nr:methylmalonyl-CoA mutase family protein [Hymenobacter oligotrophus]AYA36446.1 methylmalonyl-CoA mutase [Hymenobacter oligotrophus]